MTDKSLTPEQTDALAAEQVQVAVDVLMHCIREAEKRGMRVELSVDTSEILGGKRTTFLTADVLKRFAQPC